MNVAKEIRLSVTEPATETYEKYCWDDAWRDVGHIRPDVGYTASQVLGFIELEGRSPKMLWCITL